MPHASTAIGRVWHRGAGSRRAREGGPPPRTLAPCRARWSSAASPSWAVVSRSSARSWRSSTSSSRTSPTTADDARSARAGVRDPARRPRAPRGAAARRRHARGTAPRSSRPDRRLEQSRTSCSTGSWPSQVADRGRERRDDAIRVVIAEDEAIIRLDLRETLEEEGYEVVGETGRGDEAVELVRDLAARPRHPRHQDARASTGSRRPGDHRRRAALRRC